MKVLQFFVTGGAAYGVERTVLSMLPTLVAQGVEVSVAVLAETRAGGLGEDVARRLRECACTAHVIETGSRVPFRAARELARLVAELRADVVHSHGYKCDVASLLTRLPARRVTTVHGWCSRSWKERLYEWIDVQCDKRMDAVVALCEDYRGRLLRRGVAASKIHVAHVGVDTAAIPSGGRDFRREWGLSEGESLVVQVGRLSAEKNPALFVEVARRLAGRLPRTRFVLVGDGAEMPALRREADGLRGRLLLAGYIRGVADVFRAADVVINCSTTEGLPGALLEAGALGVPIVATAVGGVAEIVDDGVTGILCRAGDAEALAAAVERLIHDTDLRSRMGAAARSRIADEYGVERCARDLIGVYEAVCAPGARDRG